MDMTVPGRNDWRTPGRGGPIVTAVMDHRFFPDLQGKRSRRGWLVSESEITSERRRGAAARRLDRLPPIHRTGQQIN